MSRNSVVDELRSNLLEFIQESMSEKVLGSNSSEEVEFEGVTEMYSWVSSAWRWYLIEFSERTEPRGVV